SRGTAVACKTLRTSGLSDSTRAPEGRDEPGGPVVVFSVLRLGAGALPGRRGERRPARRPGARCGGAPPPAGGAGAGPHRLAGRGDGGGEGAGEGASAVHRAPDCAGLVPAGAPGRARGSAPPRRAHPRRRGGALRSLGPGRRVWRSEPRLAV